MKLNILDQSPIIASATASDAIHETLRLAAAADTMGYHRYWVAEHHNTRSFASASPEILLGRIASLTQRMRVGSGGVLLSLYSPLKIAEQFRMLETLFPARIDLGLGRASGADPATTRALQPHLATAEDGFGRVRELIGYMRKDANTSTSFSEIHAVPPIDSLPEYWILGTSPASARFAADNGLPYAFGSFINNEHCIAALQTYHQHFRPSRLLERPYVALAVFVLAAESDTAARRLVKSSELWVTQTFVHGRNIPFPRMEEAEAHHYDLREQFVLEIRRQAAVYGDVEQVAERLQQLVASLAVNELTIVTICEHFEDRLRSYQLLAEALLDTPQS